MPDLWAVELIRLLPGAEPFTAVVEASGRADALCQAVRPALPKHGEALY
jgi:hypothetical protein